MFGINGEIVNARVHNLKMGPDFARTRAKSPNQ